MDFHYSASFKRKQNKCWENSVLTEFYQNLEFIIIQTIYQSARLFYLKKVNNSLSGDKVCFFLTLYWNEVLENHKFSFFKYGMSEKFTRMLDFHLFFGIFCQNSGKLKTSDIFCKIQIFLSF